MVTVCDKCLRASCWQGIFMCDESLTAGTKEMTIAELEALRREHPSYWTESERNLNPPAPQPDPPKPGVPFPATVRKAIDEFVPADILCPDCNRLAPFHAEDCPRIEKVRPDEHESTTVYLPGEPHAPTPADNQATITLDGREYPAPTGCAFFVFDEGNWFFVWCREPFIIHKASGKLPIIAATAAEWFELEAQRIKRQIDALVISGDGITGGLNDSWREACNAAYAWRSLIVWPQLAQKEQDNGRKP